jgi:hypothetical protein
MYGGGFQHIDYATLYPSKRKHFHNWGVGAADRVIYPANTVPQDWPGLGDPPMSFSNSEPWELRSIENTMMSLGHLDKHMSILKVDVEGQTCTSTSTCATRLSIVFMHGMSRSGMGFYDCFLIQR